MTVETDVLIIGGGIVGLSAALALHQRGHTVALIDAGDLTLAPTPAPHRVYALNPSSLAFFKKLGVFETDAHAPYQLIHVWDAQNGAHFTFDSRLRAAPFLGYMAIESTLKQTLLNAIHQAAIPCYAHRKIQHITPHAQGFSVSDGTQTWTTRLLIGTDGKQSIVRQQLHVPVTQWSYHQHAIITTVQTEKPHQHTAYQVFRKEGPLAFLPLKDPHQCSIVWSLISKQAHALMDASPEAFEKALTAAFEHRLGPCTLQHPRQSFPLTMCHVQQYSGPHWLLMGDAAHTLHPLAGLGLNLGIADLTTWLNLLDASPEAPLNTKRILSAYQRQRKHALWQMIVLMQGLKTVFMAPILGPLRKVGLCVGDQEMLKVLALDWVS